MRAMTAIKCNLQVGVEFVMGEWGMVGEGYTSL